MLGKMRNITLIQFPVLKRFYRNKNKIKYFVSKLVSLAHIDLLM